MNKQQYEADKAILSGAPDEEWTHHASDDVYLCDDEGHFSSWNEFSEGWSSTRGYKLTGIRSREDIQTMCEQYERIEKLEEMAERMLENSQEIIELLEAKNQARNIVMLCDDVNVIASDIERYFSENKDD